jgi:hypothetical protein
MSPTVSSNCSYTKKITKWVCMERALQGCNIV